MPQGLVIKSTGSWFSVLFENNVIPCRIKGKFRTQGIRTSNPVCVGDLVNFDLVKEDNSGLIFSIEPRKNYIIRKATRFHHESHLIAANIDQAFLMVTLKMPQTPYEFIDRFLLASEMFFIPTSILLNKTDLLSQQEIDEFVDTYTKAGYTCHLLSADWGEGVDEVYERMKGKLTLLSGNSGVGKSTLIRKINPDLDLKIGEISEYHKSGKHTTTFSEIFKLTNDSLVIDTPGIKSFGIIDIEKNETGLYFKDIFHKSAECKFTNCTHIHEPGCAVLEAVKEGKIAWSRYRSYYNIFTDEGEKHR
ncbi:MAG: ribosome small subunit-dependent GTPase A [Bacteroidales bacterium]|nr:ribosome small subunit-dependent GTPase A [Bacteroidales bacterium]MBN2817384.1 ribosome small subunit-dependent GTPase A [Bacteroidales bacterium]